MPRKSLELMTESMLYTLMAVQTGPRCGIEISAYVEALTRGRVQLGPGTLYTILNKFQEVGYLREVAVRQCIRDAGTALGFAPEEGGVSREGPDLAAAPLPAL